MTYIIHFDSVPCRMAFCAAQNGVLCRAEWRSTAYTFRKPLTFCIYSIFASYESDAQQAPMGLAAHKKSPHVAET